MGWLFGIPDFSLAQRFTLFNDLADTAHNVPLAKKKKEDLYAAGVAAANSAMSMLDSEMALTDAMTFLQNIAISERNKEIALIKEYAKQLNKDFPFLDKFNSPEAILNDPDTFYEELTAAINEARQGTKQYLTELYRIQSNIKEQERTLANYKQDDYRYRLVNDLESFLRRLNGSFGLGGQVDEHSFSIKIQNMVMRILKHCNITGRIQNGEDFAAIAAATLTDVERLVQEEVDKEIRNNDKKKDIALISDEVLDQIEQRYLRQIEANDEGNSPVQKALNNITSIDFRRVTQNAKELLGIKMGVTSKRLEQRAKNISNLTKSRSKKSKTVRQAIKDLRQSIKRNPHLENDLMSMTFSISGSAQTKHGTVYELINSLGGVNIKANAATDVINYSIRFDLKRNDAFYDQLIGNISSEISSMVLNQNDNTPSNVKDIRDALDEMNQSISNLIEAAEEQQKKIENTNLDQMFIYHESLKLYSSVETGNSKDKGFHGRSMNILSFIDFMDSAAVDGFSLAISHNLMSFIALNLMPNAVAAQLKDPLESYFSIFAGLLMFDDVRNMALEAAKLANYSGSIKQIHLYNLNGIYVPASMVLSYVSDAVTAASTYVSDGIAAKATISVPSSNASYESWKVGEAHGDSGRNYARNELRPEHWEAVAAESASSTTVTITFLAAFQDFINKLSAL